MSQFTFSPARYHERWFCYLDLLGFTALVGSQHIRDVMLGYGDALGDLQQSKSSMHAKSVLYSWFSDTFIIYSTGDSPAHFSAAEQVSRLFFQRLILRGIPVRGALTHGPLYSQARRNIFVGPALIDAYRHAENQNWLGFVLTPSAVAKMTEIELPASERPFYRPVPPDYMHDPCAEAVYGFAFNNGIVQGKNPFLQVLTAMRDLSQPKFRCKYDRTLRFIM